MHIDLHQGTLFLFLANRIKNKNLKTAEEIYLMNLRLKKIKFGDRNVIHLLYAR